MYRRITVKRHLLLLVTPLLVPLLALNACSSPSTGVVPNKASFNGVTKVDAASGTANLSVSALRDEEVFSSGTITNPSATVTNVTTNALITQQQYSAAAAVCGQITPKDDTLSAVLTLDATGSMRTNDRNQLRAEAAKNFVARMGQGDQTAVASFDTYTSATDPYEAISVWQPFTADQAALEAAVDKATFNRGNTNLWDAGVDSVSLLKEATGGNKLVVLLTDGEDNRSASTFQDVIDAAQTEGAAIYTVGLGRSIDVSELLTTASLTGGTFSQVAAAEDLVGLYDSIFNATQASGCIELAFSPTPTPGTTLAGTLNFEVDNTPLETDYSVFFP